MNCPYCTADANKVKNCNCHSDVNNIAVCNVVESDIEIYDDQISMFQCVANPKHIFYGNDFKNNSIINCEEPSEFDDSSIEEWKNQMYNEMQEKGVEKFVEDNPQLWYIKHNCKCGAVIGSFSIDAGKKGICSNCNMIFQFPIDSISCKSLAVLKADSHSIENEICSGQFTESQWKEMNRQD